MLKDHKSKPKVLIAALDWGLGHATRMIPMINYFLQHNWEVSIASSSEAFHLLKTTFPHLKCFELPSYKAHYNMRSKALSMLFQLPKFRKAIQEEHQQTKNILKEFKADLIISDNRYGVYHANITSIFITHQLQILPPKNLFFVAPVLYRLHQKMMKHFNQIWVPDMEGNVNIGGKLSHHNNKSSKVKYVGPLSRFSHNLNSIPKSMSTENPNILSWVSGPEPERSKFKNLLLDQLQNIAGNHILLSGLPSQPEVKTINNVTVYNHLNDDEFIKLVDSSDLIICRSGYSSIMDIYYLGKQAMLIPTPGQTEQEYLAKKHFEEGIFFTQSQSKLNIKLALSEISIFKGFESIKNDNFNDLQNILSNLGFV